MTKRAALSVMTALAIAGCGPHPAPQAPEPRMPTFTGEPDRDSAPVIPVDRQVSATVVEGRPRAAATPPVVIAPRTGNVSLNFPGTDVRVVAQAVLGDQLRLPFVVAAGVNAPVTLVTAAPAPRTALFALFEDALRAANLAVTQEAGVFTIRPLDAARGQGVVAAPGVAGFATETIVLQFVSADEMKKLLDPILPGVVQRAEPGSNSLIVAGTTGQRTSVRELLKQFDVNWLRNMSFALIVPQRTDSRLIVPEVEKLINGEGAPTKGLVRLIAMDRLNGILAITAQRQYLDDVRRWIEILDREGANNERRLFVYKVQNGRSKELAKTLNAAFGNGGGVADNGPARDDFSLDGSQRGGNAVGVSRPGDAGYNPRNPANAPINQPAPATVGAPGTIPSAAGSAVAASPQAVISSDEANNAVIVFGTPRDYAVVEDALRKLDIPPLQVFIEAAITEVTLNDDLRYGVQWNFNSGNNSVALSEGATVNPVRAFPGFSYLFTNGSSITATLNALEKRTKVKVISAPKLMVLNNQTAALQVGDQVPVATQSAVGVVNPDSPIVNSIEYRDTGVILKVTPRVNAGGLVLLDIAQEVSDVATTGSSNINSPTISTRRIATSIAVQDGQTVALGGLIRDTRTKGQTGLPYISRIPVVGALFGRHDDTEIRTELLVLLKPRVVRTVDDSDAITEELRTRIRSVDPIKHGGSPP